MDSYLAASKSQAAQSNQRLKPEEIAQVKHEPHQSNAHSNHLSFIPVYSNKAACHKFPKSAEIQFENPPERKLLTTYSPPSRPRFTPGNNEIGSRFVQTHMRRRSVGFEDMTSFCYGHNMSNERRFQNPFHNSNIPLQSSENSCNFNSGNAQPLVKEELRDISFSSINQNAQLMSVENANDQMQKSFQQRFKDKSSKRKSSLNRIDFIEFSTPGNTLPHSDAHQQKNSSSDEISESKYLLRKPESPIGTSKRKHIVSPNQAAPKPEVDLKEVSASGSSSVKAKSSLLPKSSKTSHSGSRLCRWRHPPSIQLSNKLSHSAGELESLTDLSEVPTRNKSYLSAQEFDDSDFPQKLNSSVPVPVNCSSNSFQHHVHGCKSTSKSYPSHIVSQHGRDSTQERDAVDASSDVYRQQAEDQLLPSPVGQKYVDESVQRDNPSEWGPACDSGDEDVDYSAIKLENLQIVNDSSKSEIYLSAEESGDAASSDGERRRGSILRKKSFEEKKELHSILKQPPDEKSASRAPLSILKHRESSEEKESWPTGDLHSILKKSTSEDDSCNSGPDIRPILKLSTDEDSPGGSMRPRPILKKRTSFSDECSHISFSSSELKPILKKKTQLSADDQPKPILKSRRKSEDARSSVLEVFASRPRAYSADMGVKMSQEDQAESLEVTSTFSNLKTSANL